jgi:hypothetical protein
METRYLINPKNPNLHPFPRTFHAAFQSLGVSRSKIVPSNDIMVMVKEVLFGSSLGSTIIYFFSTQPAYFPLIILLRCIAFIKRTHLVIYHQMHEPWYERGRAPLKATFFGYLFNFLMSRVVDRVILPSNQALKKAQSFIPNNKLRVLNLTFDDFSTPETLGKNLSSLKDSWQSNRVISLIGGASSDRNPEGFLRMSRIAHGFYPEIFRFIRAGRDTKVSLNYSKSGVIAFHGYISEDSKEFLLSLTHFIAIPYHFSTQSAVLPEALGNGKLVILNDIPAFSHLSEEDFAFIVDFNNESELTACIDKIKNMSMQEYEFRSQHAIDYFNRNHSIQYLMNNIHLVLD